MDKNRMLELAGMKPLTEGFITDKNLHASGTGKAATTGTAGSAPAAAKPEEPNLTKKVGTGKAATTGSAGSAPAAAKPEVPNLKPVGTGKKATTGSGKMMEEASTLAAEIASKVEVLGNSLMEGQEQFMEYRLDALKRINALVSQYVD